MDNYNLFTNFSEFNSQDIVNTTQYLSSSLATDPFSADLFTTDEHKPGAQTIDSSLSISFNQIPGNSAISPISFDPVLMTQPQLPPFEQFTGLTQFAPPPPPAPIMWVAIAPAPPQTSPATGSLNQSMMKREVSPASITSSIVPAARFTPPPSPRHFAHGVMQASSISSASGIVTPKSRMPTTRNPSFRKLRPKRPRRPRACDGENRICVICGGRASGYVCFVYLVVDLRSLQ